VRRLAEQRQIAHHRVGKQLRFAPGDVDAYLRRTRVNAV
jgi:excisionase family DNA binding protein